MADTVPPDIRTVFDRYDGTVRARLEHLRAIILKTARATDGVGPIVETLKWGQPSYLPERKCFGTTVRIDRDPTRDGAVALYVHCQTDLVETVSTLYPDSFRVSGNRALIIDPDKDLPEAEIGHAVALALTYHNRRKASQS